MPRPSKCRRVCCMPPCSQFGPLGQESQASESVRMTVDEYEAIRLIDLEGMTQEECASRMQVARTTVQLIYNDARRKLAEALVQGRPLQIAGGNFKLCGEMEQICPEGFCCKGSERRPCPERESLG